MARSEQQVTQDRKVAIGDAAARARNTIRTSDRAQRGPNERVDRFIGLVLLTTRTPP